MSFSSLRLRARARLGFPIVVIGMLLAPVVSAAPASDTDKIAVSVDQAKLIKVPERTATIVIGNPLIADVALQTGGVMVVTGKGYGSTNFIAMDRSGVVLVDRVIQVLAPPETLVTVYRGVERETYSCMPNCERRVTLGDSDKYFKAVLDQTSALSHQAASSAAASGRPAN